MPECEQEIERELAEMDPLVAPARAGVDRRREPGLRIDTAGVAIARLMSLPVPTRLARSNILAQFSPVFIVFSAFLHDIAALSFYLSTHSKIQSNVAASGNTNRLGGHRHAHASVDHIRLLHPGRLQHRGQHLDTVARHGREDLPRPRNVGVDEFVGGRSISVRVEQHRVRETYVSTGLLRGQPLGLALRLQRGSLADRIAPAPSI